MIEYKIGDCRTLLKEVPDGSIQLVVTSPPYNIGKPYGKYKDKIALTEITVEVENTEELNNVIKNVRKVDSVYEVKRRK